MIQRPFPFLSSCPAPKPAPDALVMAAPNALAAARIAIQAAKLKQAYVARAMGISPSYLSMILGGQSKIPDDFPEALSAITGSTLMEQRLAVDAALRRARGAYTEREREHALAEQLRRAA